jgi:hypothetical protein
MRLGSLLRSLPASDLERYAATGPTMTTYGQNYRDSLSSAIDELERLSHAGYSEDDIRSVISIFGSQTELFLKSVVFPGSNARDDFFTNIERLGSLGTSPDDVDKFHAVRKLYNKAKHDPQHRITLLATSQTIRDLRDPVDKLIALAPGNCKSPKLPSATRVFWVCAWDHYIGGDTEIAIYIPGESDHWLGPPDLDRIYIKLSSWDDVKSQLSAIGELHDGRGIIPEAQYKLYSEEGDFLAALVFEGEYRDLMTILSSHELRQELLPGLNRQDTGRYMVIALLLAFLDVASDDAAGDLEGRLISHATSNYAVPDNYPHLKAITQSLVGMVSTVAPEDLIRLNGPHWVNADVFEKEMANAIGSYPDFKIIITPDLRVVQQWAT